MRSAKTLANLQKVLTLLNSSLSLDEMLTQAAQQLVEMFEVDHSGVLLFQRGDTEGTVIAEYPARDIVGLKVPLTGYPLHERLLEEQKPIAVIEAQNDPLMGRVRTTMRALGIQSIVIIPLVVQGKIVGSLSLDAVQKPRSFTAAELELCQLIGKQIAVAVDYTRALELAEANRRQAQTLGEINRALSESLDLDEILPLILKELEKVLPVDGNSIYLLVEGGIQLRAYQGESPFLAGSQIIPLTELWGAAEIVRSKKPLLVGDTGQYPGWNVYAHQAVKSWLGVPLLVRGEIVGILNMAGYAPEQFDQSHIQLAQAFADQSALAIHNARLYGQAEKRADLLALVQQIGLSIASSLDLQDVLLSIITHVRTLLEAGEVRIYLYDRQTDSFTPAIMPGEAGNLKITLPHPRPDGLSATVARTGRYLAVPNILEHPLYRSQGDIYGFKAIIGVPLKKGDEVLGVLNVFYKDPHHFLAEEIDLLYLLATQAAVALENARLYELEVKQVEQELDIARRIQRGFLPENIPSLPGWRIAALCLPARETGGDFYEFVHRSDRLLGLVVGDVSGKSIPAAMLMAAAQSLVSAKGTDYRSPARVVTETNRLLYEDVPPGSFVALSYALVAPEGDRVWLSSAGQLDPFLVPADGQPVRLIDTPGCRLPLGVVLELSYQETCLSLAPGDMIIFYTDGVVERKGPAGNLFGFERTASILEKLRGQSPEAALQALLEATDRFAHGAGPDDDVTLLAIQRLTSD